MTVTDPDTGQTETATITYAAANGALSGAGLTGAAGSYGLSAPSAAALQAALQALVFTPTMNQATPGATVQTAFTVQVSDGGSTTSVGDTVTVGGVNDAPVLGGVPASTTAPSSAAVALASALTLADPDAGASVRAAQVAITAGLASGDVLSVSSLPAGVSAAYNAATGVLTLTGAASDAAYQAALQTVSFSHPGSTDASARTISFTVTDDGGATSPAASETVNVSPFGPAAPAPPATPPPSQAAGYAVQIDNLIRAVNTDPGLANPLSPLYAQVQAEKAIAAQLDAGQISPQNAQLALYHLVDGATSVAEISYAFFTGKTPTAAGLDYLVNSPSNPNNLDSAYYALFSTQNRYINFAASLGRFGDAAATSAYHQAYDGLSLTDATAKAYQAIFGSAPNADKVNAILNTLVPDGLGGQETRAQYFAYYGTDGLNGVGTKSAMIGWLLADSVAEGFGTYQQADLHFLQDLAHGTASFNVDLLKSYATAPNLVGQPVVEPTLGS